MNIEKTAQKTIRQFRLLNKKEKILVAVSGGKDSTTAIYLLNRLDYNVEAITVDAQIGNYTKTNLENIKNFCKKLKIKLHIISFRKEFGHSLCALKSILHSKNIKLSSCAICGVLRRYLLNKHSRLLKADKLVTGHNLNDEAQSIVMNLFKNNLNILAKIGPITGTTKDKKFVPRVKPLYLIPEKEIEKYSKKMKFPVKYGVCPCRAGVYRCMINGLLTNHEKNNPKTHENIVNLFLAISPKLKKQFKSTNQSHCKNCGEPSKKELCMTCNILSNLR